MLWRALRTDGLTGMILVVAAAALVAGLFLPAISTRFLFFEQRYSMIDGVAKLYADGQLFLFALVGLFSVVVPTAKILFLLFVWLRADRPSPAVARALDWTQRLAKWSMLDVFIIAVMLVAINGTLFTTADVHIGVMLFAVAILISSLAAGRLTARSRRGALPEPQSS